MTKILLIWLFMKLRRCGFHRWPWHRGFFEYRACFYVEIHSKTRLIGFQLLPLILCKWRIGYFAQVWFRLLISEPLTPFFVKILTWNYSRLGIFGCMLGMAGAIMDHKFVLIGTIWLCSFTSASYVIKLSWELISLLIQYTQSEDKDNFPVHYWPMLVKYGKGFKIFSL